MTNFDKIKSMNIEEMSEFLSNTVTCVKCPVSDFCDEDTTYQECPERFKQWLLSESENAVLKSQLKKYIVILAAIVLITIVAISLIH